MNTKAGDIMLNDSFYREIIKQSAYVYFYCELIRDAIHKTADFRVLDINSSFEEMFKCKEENILGKRMMDILPDFFDQKCDWYLLFEEAVSSKKGITKGLYIKCLNGWFNINILNCNEDYFVVTLMRINKTEGFMKALTDNLPFAAWAKDETGRYIAVNKKYEKDIGFSFDKIKGKTDIEIWPPHLAKQYMDEDCEVMNEGRIKHIKDFFLSGIWYETYKAPYYDENGNITGTIGFSINITQEKMAKKELEQRNKFLKILINANPDFISYKDINGIYTILNYSLASRYYGKKEEELIGKSCKDIICNGEVCKTITIQDNEIVSEKQTKTYEETLKLADGSIRSYETIKVPCFDEERNVIGVLAISRDITQRINAENKLRESEEKFRQLVENIDGMFLIRENEQIIYASPGYEQIFGRSCEELYKSPRSFLDAVHPEDRNKFLEYRHGFKENTVDNAYLKINFNEYLEETFRVIRPDGEIRWVWMKSFPVTDEGGRVVRRLSIGHDITAIKEAEARLERLRMEFFANLSHEFRTPLNLVFSSLQMMDLKLRGNTCSNTSSIEKYMNIIKQNSFRLLRLINNLIDTTEMDAGYFEYFPENEDIVTYIRKIVDSVDKFLGDKDIKLAFHTEIEKKIIAFDIDKMERIILNLLSNAIKFNKPEGKIEVNISIDDKFVAIHVKDTGIGIPEDKLQDIFQRFKQIHDRLTKVSEGSAIGLSLVKSLVEMHNGTINVKSSLGEGTEFIIRLPNVLVESDKIMFLNKNHIASNSRNERVQIELSDIYGLSS